MDGQLDDVFSVAPMQSTWRSTT